MTTEKNNDSCWFQMHRRLASASAAKFVSLVYCLQHTREVQLLLLYCLQAAPALLPKPATAVPPGLTQLIQVACSFGNTGQCCLQLPEPAELNLSSTAVDCTACCSTLLACTAWCRRNFGHQSHSSPLPLSSSSASPVGSPSSRFFPENFVLLVIVRLLLSLLQ